MRLGIMQPYFFPYLGYFSLIKHVDKFILFDTAQFIRHGWIERNRILKPGGGWQYFSVPLCKHSQKTPINKIEINNQISWKSKILAQMVHYKKAPYYEAVIHLLQDIFQEDFKDIVSFDWCSLKKVCDYLDIKTEITVFSTMELHIEDANAPDEWALNICKSLPNTDEYWNPPGGKDFFDIAHAVGKFVDFPDPQRDFIQIVRYDTVRAFQPLLQRCGKLFVHRIPHFPKGFFVFFRKVADRAGKVCGHVVDTAVLRGKRAVDAVDERGIAHVAELIVFAALRFRFFQKERDQQEQVDHAKYRCNRYNRYTNSILIHCNYYNYYMSLIR